MSGALTALPRYLVLEPKGTVRLQVEVEADPCELNLELENRKPGRSFVLLVRHPGGRVLERVRLAGRARIVFDGAKPGEYVLMLANPTTDPAVIRIEARNVPRRAPRTAASARTTGRRSAGRARARTTASHVRDAAAPPVRSDPTERF